MTHTSTAKHDASQAITCIPPLPTEIWLQILEHDDPKHMWLSVRNSSSMYRDCVERLFTSKYLPKLSIALSLPRRDPATGKMRWRGDPIPGSQLKMTYSRLSEDGKHLRLESPAVVKDRSSERTLEELKDAGTLPKERLEEAPAYVSMSSLSFAGLTVDVPVQVDWDEARKIWVWDIEWSKLLSRFYDAKEKQAKRWPSTSREITKHERRTR
ncbi:uncharacterized protein EKO05_0000127 [Ascochyta rabiei]|uniref:Uncharacterized protein n=1 Tax=Didymella rabiei TaxID=5454 RepID=A0A163K5R5_DIDRA|nr:uncharacterized protein EKO05_0000127 [Ascochyta rabiei]KZM26785.1 hypothetical protein ST47_g2072 [Ascochyta rabiei]UPX09438.1 hypothetical protein EKO05_0000127 [Ascochyta rabiei]